MNPIHPLNSLIPLLKWTRKRSLLKTICMKNPLKINGMGRAIRIGLGKSSRFNAGMGMTQIPKTSCMRHLLESIGMSMGMIQIGLGKSICRIFFLGILTFLMPSGGIMPWTFAMDRDGSARLEGSFQSKKPEGFFQSQQSGFSDQPQLPKGLKTPAQSESADPLDFSEQSKTSQQLDFRPRERRVGERNLLQARDTLKALSDRLGTHSETYATVAYVNSIKHADQKKLQIARILADQASAGKTDLVFALLGVNSWKSRLDYSVLRALDLDELSNRTDASYLQIALICAAAKGQQTLILALLEKYGRIPSDKCWYIKDVLTAAVEAEKVDLICSIFKNFGIGDPSWPDYLIKALKVAVNFGKTQIVLILLNQYVLGCNQIEGTDSHLSWMHKKELIDEVLRKAIKERQMGVVYALLDHHYGSSLIPREDEQMLINSLFVHALNVSMDLEQLDTFSDLLKRYSQYATQENMEKILTRCVSFRGSRCLLDYARSIDILLDYCDQNGITINPQLRANWTDILTQVQLAAQAPPQSCLISSSLLIRSTSVSTYC